MTSPPGGEFLGLRVGSPAHSPQDPDRSSLIHAAPGLTRLHLTALHTAPGQPASAAMSSQTWAQTHLPFPTCSPSWTSPCLSKPVGVHTCTPGMMPAWTSRDVLRPRWDKTWKTWESVSQAGSAPSPCMFVILPSSCLSLFRCPPTVLFIFPVLGCVCLSVYVLTL